MITEMKKQLYCPLENTKHEMYCKNTSSDSKFRTIGVLCGYVADCYDIKTKLEEYNNESRWRNKI